MRFSLLFIALSSATIFLQVNCGTDLSSSPTQRVIIRSFSAPGTISRTSLKPLVNVDRFLENLDEEEKVNAFQRTVLSPFRSPVKKAGISVLPPISQSIEQILVKELNKAVKGHRPLPYEDAKLVADGIIQTAYFSQHLANYMLNRPNTGKHVKQILKEGSVTTLSFGLHGTVALGLSSKNRFSVKTFQSDMDAFFDALRRQKIEYNVDFKPADSRLKSCRIDVSKKKGNRPFDSCAEPQAVSIILAKGEPVVFTVAVLSRLEKNGSIIKSYCIPRCDNCHKHGPQMGGIPTDVIADFLEIPTVREIPNTLGKRHLIKNLLGAFPFRACGDCPFSNACHVTHSEEYYKSISKSI